MIPVYQAEGTLRTLVEELAQFLAPFETRSGHKARVLEVLAVHDNGPDRSDLVLRQLAAEHAWFRPIWLSRNFGQHAATLAGISESRGDWVATLDEDGQHDPAFLGAMLDVAMRAQADVVYAKPTNRPPHGWMRNATSLTAKRFLGLLSGTEAPATFNSYRLVLGEVARSVAVQAGVGIYFDVALGWVARRRRTCLLPLRREGEDRRSGYRLRSLLSHFWRMILTQGTRPLRLVSMTGAISLLAGVVFASVVLVRRLVGDIAVQGWSTMIIVMLLGTGAILFCLGIVAEYVGVAVNKAMGRPLYLIVSDPMDGPLGYGSGVAPHAQQTDTLVDQPNGVPRTSKP